VFPAPPLLPLDIQNLLGQIIAFHELLHLMSLAVLRMLLSPLRRFTFEFEAQQNET
jgi:hypothetical protein